MDLQLSNAYIRKKKKSQVSQFPERERERMIIEIRPETIKAVSKRRTFFRRRGEKSTQLITDKQATHRTSGMKEARDLLLIWTLKG